MIEHSGSSGGYAWTTGPSGECNAPCGGGTKQREIFCSAKVSLHMHTYRAITPKLLPRTLLSVWMRVYATHTTDQKRRSLAMKILAGQGKRFHRKRWISQRGIVRWMVGSWGNCTQDNATDCTSFQFRNVFCEQILANNVPSLVSGRSF